MKSEFLSCEDLSERNFNCHIKIRIILFHIRCIDTMDQIQQKCWNIFNNDNVSQKDKLLALKIIKETCESKFSLIEKGPSVMALNSLHERVEKIESSSNNEFRYNH